MYHSVILQTQSLDWTLKRMPQKRCTFSQVYLTEGSYRACIFVEGKTRMGGHPKLEVASLPAMEIVQGMIFTSQP